MSNLIAMKYQAKLLESHIWPRSSVRNPVGTRSIASSTDDFASVVVADEDHVVRQNQDCCADTSEFLDSNRMNLR